MIQQQMEFPDGFYKYYASPQEVMLPYNAHYYQFYYNQEHSPNYNFGPQGVRTHVPTSEANISVKEECGDQMFTIQPSQPQPVMTPVKIQTKVQQIYEPSIRQGHPVTLNSKAQKDVGEKSLKQKILKKNTESNMVNSIFSYICYQAKSHRIVGELTQWQTQKIQIFYIFANNFRRINGKYINRRNIKAICEIVPKQPHHRILSKSIRRLLVLPMKELRVIFRKLIYNYLRGPQSIISLMTSKKLSKEGVQDHLKRRRQLQYFMETMLQDYN